VKHYQHLECESIELRIIVDTDDENTEDANIDKKMGQRLNVLIESENTPIGMHSNIATSPIQ
jgi:hypothetical protein